MGKLFHGKNKYPDEEFDDENMLEEDEELEDEELEDDDLDDDEEEADDEGLEDDEEEADDEGLEDDDDLDDEESEEGDCDSDDDESEDEELEDDEDDEEEDRRAYRRKRRIRNQIISYSIVAVILAAIVTGGVVVGRSIADVVKEKKLAEEQIKLQEQQEAEAAHDVVIDTPEPIELEPEEDYLGNVIENNISNMPLEDKVAGLFIVTPEALTGVTTATQAGDGTKDALDEYAVGGLIYFDQNIIDKEQITEMLSSTTAKSKYPIFLAVDEEGGSVSRVAKSGIDVIQVGNMSEIGASGDAAQAYEAGLNIGNYLKELGFNLDFAPVADVGSEDSALGNRIFGSDAQLVAEMVSNAVDGIEGAGVSSCLKHFPGLGDTTDDTHDGRVETSKTLDEMRESDFVPFRAGIDAGADFVMVSHVTMSAVEEDAVPSSLSKFVMTDVLRGELGFQGVIITDALNMGAITEYYTSEEAVIMAIDAGADMLLMPEDFKTAYDALLAAVQDGTIPEERINESLARIYRIKYADTL